MADVKLNSVTPILQVSDLQRSIDFYRDALGFGTGWIVGEPPWLASVCRDEVEFHLFRVEKPVPSHVYLNVNGVDTYFQRCRLGRREGAASARGSRIRHA